MNFYADAITLAPEQHHILGDQPQCTVLQVIAVICVLVWIINIGRFSDPVHGSWVCLQPSCSSCQRLLCLATCDMLGCHRRLDTCQHCKGCQEEV